MTRCTLTTAVLAGAAALALNACATGEGDAGAQPESFADYQADPRLGPRVDRICFGSQIDGFGETTDDTVLVESGVNDWHLLHTFSCPDLDFARRLGFDRFGACLREGDAVIPFQSISGADRNDPAPQRCRIRAIYEWDPGAALEGQDL